MRVALSPPLVLLCVTAVAIVCGTPSWRAATDLPGLFVGGRLPFFSDIDDLRALKPHGVNKLVAENRAIPARGRDGAHASPLLDLRYHDRWSVGTTFCHRTACFDH